MTYEELIDEYVPNFRRFEKVLDEENEALIDIALLLKKVYDAWLLETVWKYINLELWICILRDWEIDGEKLKEMMKTFKNK